MDTPEQPLFLAKDVAEWIDYSKTSKGSFNISAVVSSIDEEGKLVLKTLITGDIQQRSHTILTEDGLYEVLMQSRKQIAKAFKNEVKSILKQIRMNGGYIPVVYGGFGPDQKVILAKTIAEIHGMELREINQLIKKER